MRLNKADSYLSIAAKGGFIQSGEFSTEKAVKAGKAYLVICAEDSSDNTKKHFKDMCQFYQVPYYEYGYKMQLAHNIGKEMRACLACIDSGLSKTIINQLSSIQGITGGNTNA